MPLPVAFFARFCDESLEDTINKGDALELALGVSLQYQLCWLLCFFEF